MATATTPRLLPTAKTKRTVRIPRRFSQLFGRLLGFAVMVRSVIAYSLIAFGVQASTICYAGGGPENVFLIVNQNSQDSLTVANHYIALRDIPVTNVFHLPYRGSKFEISGAPFRDKILLPVIAEIERRGLTKQIDYIVYSCDFPWRIFVGPDFPKEKFPKQFAPRGAITGMTYLHDFVLQKRKEVVSLNTNWYCTQSQGGLTISRAFRSQYHWAVGGRRSGNQGLKYMISSMLGVTDGRGNTVPEILNSLKLAKIADGTKPKGTVYYMKHGGPRSKPRHDRFASAATELRGAGVEAKVLMGKYPDHKSGIAGLTCGVAYVKFNEAGCRFSPGAFCDNLTSYGALFSKNKLVFNKKTGKKNSHQTTVADFIRHGATAASGTVFEPYAIQHKFPLASVHVHYARGCSLGEAFYQSVSGPYQQLLVGDPLCQPWATFPIVKIAEIRAGQLLRGEIEISPKTVENEEAPIKRFELFVDGVRTQTCRPGKSFTLDTLLFRDGHHELRIVAVDDTPIETQGHWIVDVLFKNKRNAIQLSMKQKRIAVGVKQITVDVASNSKAAVDVFCSQRKLGSVASGTGTIRILTKLLGTGPVEIYAVSKDLRSRPLKIEIPAPKSSQQLLAPEKRFGL